MVAYTKPQHRKKEESERYLKLKCFIQYKYSKLPLFQPATVWCSTVLWITFAISHLASASASQGTAAERVTNVWLGITTFRSVNVSNFE